jgi:hypothetical protein
MTDDADEIETFRVKKHERDELRVVLSAFDGRRHLAVQTLRRDVNGANPTKEKIEARAHVWDRLLPEIAAALDLMKAEGGEL